jgi:type III pantothenate kinase
MVLAVDIGNTNIVMGCFESDRILFVERLSTNQQELSLRTYMGLLLKR